MPHAPHAQTLSAPRVQKNYAFRLRSANLETSKSRGLSSEAQTSKRATRAPQTPDCITQATRLRIKPLEFPDEAQSWTLAASRDPYSGVCSIALSGRSHTI